MRSANRLNMDKIHPYAIINSPGDMFCFEIRGNDHEVVQSWLMVKGCGLDYEAVKLSIIEELRRKCEKLIWIH